MKLFPSPVRRTWLTLHVLVSAGWFGSVLAFLVIAVAGATITNAATASGMYEGLRLLVWWAILPLSLLAFITGVVQSLGTSWGMFRHYWVVFKLVLNLGSVLLLALHTQVIDRAAFLSGGDESDAVRLQLVFDSAAALVVLTLITVLAVVKPRGITGWGRRQAGGARTPPVVP